MKAHPYDPNALARKLSKDVLKDLSATDVLEDMRGFPALYYSDHLQACENGGTLPLSEMAWRRACLSS